MRKRERSARVRRVAVMGIGNELRGDDAAGVLAARALQAAAHEHFLVVEAATAPENQTGLLRRFRPDLVLLIDAAEMGEAAGSVRWLAWEDTDGLSASTHTTPPSMLARFLVETLGCEVAVVGIQPHDTGFDSPVSPAVAAAVAAVVSSVQELFAGGFPAWIEEVVV
jgi:hydrogenase 3 maturation protease